MLYPHVTEIARAGAAAQLLPYTQRELRIATSLRLNADQRLRVAKISPLGIARSNPPTKS